jgi:hypothetical protein
MSFYLNSVGRKRKQTQSTIGTRNQPDFVVMPEGSAGFCADPRYDDRGAEMGVALSPYSGDKRGAHP